LNTWWT